MTINQKRKGNRVEYKIVKLFEKEGYRARRQPMSGAILGLPHDVVVPETAVRIMTGAPIPEGADTVAVVVALQSRSIAAYDSVVSGFEEQLRDLFAGTTNFNLQRIYLKDREGTPRVWRCSYRS